MNKQTQFVYDIIIKNSLITSILNIGYRHDSDHTILNACFENNKTFDVLEAYKPNCDFLSQNEKITNIYNIDVKDIKTINKKYDAIIWLHGPEHILWKDFLCIKYDIENMAKYITIYQAPEGEYPQDEIYGNPYERHVQTLYESMFSEIGYETNNFIKHGERTFSAIKRKCLI